MATRKTSGTSSTKSTGSKTTGSKTTGTARARTSATSRAKSTTAKPAAARKPAVKTPAARKPKAPAKVAAKTAATTAPVAKTAALQGVTLDAADEPKTYGKRDLFEKSKLRSGVKGRDVRKVMDAVLEEIGAALVRGETLKLMPLGTVKIQRQKDAGNADVVVCKLRRKKDVPGPKDPLAEAAE